MNVELTTRGLLSALFRQRRRFAFIFLLIAGGGAAYLLTAKPQYEISGSLLVKFGHDATADIARPDNANMQFITQNDRREITQSNMDILQSRSLLLATVHDIGAENLYPGITARVAGTDLPEDAAVKKLYKGDLIVKSSELSNVLNITLIIGNPQVGASFMSHLFELFIARQAEVFDKQQTDFLDSQVKASAQKLAQSQQALKDFKAKTGISSIDDELALLLQQKGDTKTVSLDSNNDAWANLADLQAKEAQALTTYRPDSPQVLHLHEGVEAAQKQFNQRRADLNSRTGKVTTGIDRRIAQLEAQRTSYNDLQRQVQLDEDNYKNYQQRSETARINDTLNHKSITSISVIDEPQPPMKPARPRKMLVFAMTLLAACIFSIGGALAYETLDNRFTAPAQLAHALNVPVLASFAAPAEG